VTRTYCVFAPHPDSKAVQNGRVVSVHPTLKEAVEARYDRKQLRVGRYENGRPSFLSTRDDLEFARVLMGDA
jgi:hypothetical protein